MLRVAFLDVGQGDTTVVWNPETQQAVVVDCVNAVGVWDLLQREKIRNVPAVIVTHLHTDHYQQLTNFLEGCQSRGIQWNSVYLYWSWPRQSFTKLSDDDDGHSIAEESNPDLYNKKKRGLYQNLQVFLKKASRNQVKALHQVEDIQIPGIRIEFLHPFYKDIGVLQDSGKLNNTSAVLRVSDGAVSVLLTGDLEPDGWQVLLQNISTDLKSDVLRFPHHGSWKASNVTSFLDQISPQIVVMSVGSEGYTRYQHPNPSVFEALKDYSETQVLCTQVTSQCCLDPTKRCEQIRSLLNVASGAFNDLFLRRGCPCASTIVLELGDQVKIVQPLPETHQRIVASFSAAQCRKSSVST